jgi:signal transduction histidine kinase
MKTITTVFLLLFAYTIAALVFWGISLQRQNLRIYQQDIQLLKNSIDSTANPQLFSNGLKELDTKHNARIKQYIGEGSAFLLVIIIGASIVVSFIRRNIKLNRQQNNFMLSVTHELKSPIAAMKLNLQTLEKYRLDEQKQKLLVERCIKEANRLNDLFNNVLFATQIEGRSYVPSFEKFDLYELVEDSINDYANRYPRPFDEDLEPCTFNGDRLMLQMALNNLLENAVKYTPSDKAIMVKLTKQVGYIKLQVIDQGHGIPDAEKRKVFNKFYRIGNEESRKSKGTGLGLYLTSKIIAQHNGTITVKNNMPNGSIFEISLPV